MRRSFYLSLIFIISSCQYKNANDCRVVVRMVGTSADSVTVRRISLNNEPGRKMDSGLLRYSRDSLVFLLPRSGDSLFQFSLKFSDNSVYCIPETANMAITFEKKTGRSNITGSSVSESLLTFQEMQDSLIRLWRQTSFNRFPLFQGNPHYSDSVRLRQADLNTQIQQRYYQYADTVSNVVAFMLIFDQIDFQSDAKRMQHLVNAAIQRFPGFPPLARLNKQVQMLAHIQEAELKIGDVFPELELPDLNGFLYSVRPKKGKYLLVSFWSSWCKNCMAYDPVMNTISSASKFKNLEMIHIAMDNNLRICKDIVERNNMPGTQLIDKDIWQGQTAQKLAFDSIPFNFLIGPEGKIISKAIPADSLILVIKKYIR